MSPGPVSFPGKGGKCLFLPDQVPALRAYLLSQKICSGDSSFVLALPEARLLPKGEWVDVTQAVGSKVHNAQGAGEELWCHRQLKGEPHRKCQAVLSFPSLFRNESCQVCYSTRTGKPFWDASGGTWFPVEVDNIVYLPTLG